MNNTRNKEFKVELPNTDLIRVFKTQEELTSFLTSHAVEAVYDTERNVHRVPAFKEGRDAFIAAKIIDCARWGCE